MEASFNLASFKDILIVLAAAGVVVPLFQRLKINPVVGFILVGLAVGPHGFGGLVGPLPWLKPVTIADPEAIGIIGQFGIVLLLFMIGLELSIERLWLMRRLVFGLGSLQLVLSVILLLYGGILLGLSPVGALVLGLAFAMSSTAVALQVLSQHKNMTAPHGRASFGILLFQDLAAVPILFGLGALAAGAEHLDPTRLGLALGSALLAVVLIVAFGRFGLRPLLRLVARTESPEFFMAASLLVVFAAALATAAAGLSMPLGALIGGLLIAGTEYRRQIEVTIDPFKGLLVGVFLISIGMSLDLQIFFAHPASILAAVIGVVVLKLVIIAVLGRFFGLSWTAGIRSGLLLGPGGEFGFVILAFALSQGLLSEALSGPALIVTALSMAAIPALGWLGRRLEARIGAKAASTEASDALTYPPTGPAGGARVVIAGFGRVGQTVAALLDAHGIPYVAFDRDIGHVTRLRQQGKPLYWGDIATPELLRRLDLAQARALVVTLDDPIATSDVVALARAEQADLRIIARARDATHAARLYRQGASDAVPETIEASLQLSEAVLVGIGIPMGPVIVSIHAKREELQDKIRQLAPEAKLRPLGVHRIGDDAEQAGKRP